MNCDELDDETLDSIINAAAWNDISERYEIPEVMLYRYEDKINWHLLSRNRGIQWDAFLLEIWEKYLDWEELSGCDNESLHTPEVIIRHINRWNMSKMFETCRIELDFLLHYKILESINNPSVWDVISAYAELPAVIINGYADKLNWKKISQNCEIHWTIDLVKQWEDRLDWDILSGCLNEHLFTPEMLDGFINRWNWRILSSNWILALDYDIIDRYIDKWDWGRLINRDSNLRNVIYNYDFFERYKEQIPIDTFMNSSTLLVAMQEEVADQIKEEMFSPDKDGCMTIKDYTPPSE